MRIRAHSLKTAQPKCKIPPKYADKVDCQQPQQPKTFVSEQNGLGSSTVAGLHGRTLVRFRSAHLWEREKNGRCEMKSILNEENVTYTYTYLNKQNKNWPFQILEV